jgi:hypothetical protein
VGTDRGAPAQPHLRAGVHDGSTAVAGRRPGSVSTRHVLASTVRVRACAHRGDVTPPWLQSCVKPMMGDAQGDLARASKCPHMLERGHPR